MDVCKKTWMEKLKLRETKHLKRWENFKSKPSLGRNKNDRGFHFSLSDVSSVPKKASWRECHIFKPHLGFKWKPFYDNSQCAVSWKAGKWVGSTARKGEWRIKVKVFICSGLHKEFSDGIRFILSFEKCTGRNSRDKDMEMFYSRTLIEKNTNQ